MVTIANKHYQEVRPVRPVITDNHRVGCEKQDNLYAALITSLQQRKLAAITLDTTKLIEGTHVLNTLKLCEVTAISLKNVRLNSI